MDNTLQQVYKGFHYFYCPNKEAALGSIVVSLSCTTYHCGSLILFL